MIWSSVSRLQAHLDVSLSCIKRGPIKAADHMLDSPSSGGVLDRSALQRIAQSAASAARSYEKGSERLTAHVDKGLAMARDVLAAPRKLKGDVLGEVAKTRRVILWLGITLAVIASAGVAVAVWREVRRRPPDDAPAADR